METECQGAREQAVHRGLTFYDTHDMKSLHLPQKESLMKPQKLTLEQKLEALMDKMEREAWKITVICVEMMLITTLLALIFDWPLLVSRIVVGISAFFPLGYWFTGYLDRCEQICLEIKLLERRQEVPDSPATNRR